MVDILVSSRGNHGAFFSVNTHTEWDQQTKFQLYNNFFRVQTFNDRTIMAGGEVIKESSAVRRVKRAVAEAKESGSCRETDFEP